MGNHSKRGSLGILTHIRIYQVSWVSVPSTHQATSHNIGNLLCMPRPPCAQRSFPQISSRKSGRPKNGNVERLKHLHFAHPQKFCMRPCHRCFICFSARPTKISRFLGSLRSQDPTAAPEPRLLLCWKSGQWSRRCFSDMRSTSLASASC